MYGGEGMDFAPTQDDWIEFDDFYIFTYKPAVDVPRGNSEYWGTSDELDLPNWVNP